MNVKSYNQKIDDGPSKGNYNPLPKDPKPTIERILYRILKKDERHLNILTQSPHIYGLPKIHKTTDADD